MRRENLNLFFAMLIIGAVIIGAYVFVSNPVTDTTQTTIPVPSQPVVNTNTEGMNPGYGDLTEEQIAVADIAIGALLNSSEGITPPMVNVVSFEAQEFSNAALGCPQPDQMYAEVITPGYQVILEAQGTTYDYRLTDAENVILCEQ